MRSILGLLITMAGPDTNHGAALRERLRAEYRERVFHTEIATSRALQEAPGTVRDHLPARAALTGGRFVPPPGGRSARAPSHTTRP